MKKLPTLIFAIFITFAGVGFLYHSIRLYITKIQIIKSEDISIINSVLENNPAIIKAGRGKWIEIKTTNFPKYFFEIQGNAYSAIDTRAFLKNLHAGDSVFIGIKKKEYEEKFLAKTNQTQNDVVLFDVYTLSGKFDNILTLDDYNYMNRNDNGCFFEFFFGLFFVGISIFPFRNFIRSTFTRD